MPSLVALAVALLPLIVCTYGSAQYNSHSFCSAVDGAITSHGEQQAATSFCSSYLHLSPSTIDTTVTSVKSFVSTGTVSSTGTVTATVYATDTLTTTFTSDTTVLVTASATSFVTSVESTSTTFITTLTITSTASVTATMTQTSTPTTTIPLTCSAPQIASRKKRTVGETKSKKKCTSTTKAPTPSPSKPSKPTCFSGYPDGPAISSACSCLSLTRSTTTRTSFVTSSQTGQTTVTVHVTQNATATATTTTLRTVTQVVSVPTTTTLSTTDIVPSTSTASLVSTTQTITTTTVATATQTVQASTTATRYSSFALLSSLNSNYGRVVPSIAGSSASGVQFTNPQKGSAATFAFSGGNNILYYQSTNVRSYQQSSGNYYIVTNPGFGVFGYTMTCNLDMRNPSAGCPLACDIGGSGLFPDAQGNNVMNYNSWGLQGPASSSKFTVYAVGQT